MGECAITKLIDIYKGLIINLICVHIYNIYIFRALYTNVTEGQSINQWCKMRG